MTEEFDEIIEYSRPYSARTSQPCIVKLGTPIHVLSGRTDLSQSARRLEVLKQCVGYIFSDKIAEAKKVCSFMDHYLRISFSVDEWRCFLFDQKS